MEDSKLQAPKARVWHLGNAVQHWTASGAGKGKLQKVQTKCWSKHETGKESAPAGDDERRVGGTVQLHFVWEGTWNDKPGKHQGWGAGSAGRPSPGNGGRDCPEPPSGSLPAAPLPPDPAPLLMAGQSSSAGDRDPPGPAGWEPGALSPALPWAGSGTEPEQSLGCCSLQYRQSPAKQVWSAGGQVPTKGLERAWKREWGVEIPAYF